MSSLHNYPETRAYIEKEHLDWFKALIPRSINAPVQYWSQKCLAISANNAAMMNVRSSQDLRQTPNPASVAIQSQMAGPPAI